MPPVGRPPHGRGISDLGHLLLPEVIVLDTSAVVEALLDDQPHHDDYAEFLERAIAADATLAYCGLLDLELAEACITITLRRAHRGRWRAHRRDGRALRPARRLMHDVFRRWHRMIDSARSARIPLADVQDLAIALMHSHPLLSYDAAHAATAVMLDAPLLCLDGDFARVPEHRLQLLTDGSRLRRFRTLRQGTT